MKKIALLFTLCTLYLCGGVIWPPFDWLSPLRAQTIQLLPVPEDSTGQYSYRSDPIVYHNKLYLRSRNASGNNVLVAYDGQNYTIYPSPAGFDGNDKGYQRDLIIYKDKLYLTYRGNNSVHHLAVFDGTALEMLDLPEGYRLRMTATDPFIQQDILYLSCLSNGGTGTLMAFDGESFQPVTTPSEYQGTNKGYRSGPDMIGDTAVMTFRKAGSRDDLAYLIAGELHFVPSPPGYDGNGRGYDGHVISFAGKWYARYQNSAGGFDLGILESDSLRFQTVPDSLDGDAVELQSLAGAAVLGDQLLLRVKRSGGSFALVTYRDTSFRLIAAPPGFEVDEAGWYDPPLIHQGQAYYTYYNNDYFARTLIFDGTELRLVDMPNNEQEAGLGEDGFYLIDGQIYTAYFKDFGNQCIAVLQGDQATVLEQPLDSTTFQVFNGPMVPYRGEYYFGYSLEGQFGVLAKLSSITSVQPIADRSPQLRLYPNPTPGRQLTIELAQAGDGPLRVQLLDLAGRPLREVLLQNAGPHLATQLDLSGVSAGVYVVRLIRAGRFQAVGKIVLLD